MALWKCKMCGGDLEADANKSYGTCSFCGSTMTLPRGNEERIVNLFNRANHYRRQNEFDKALASYEGILEEDNNNAEAHWGVVLSRYGIEYVEDPKTHERIPTCNRVQNESILSDLDYKAAVSNAEDNYARELYEKEAGRISEIQKGILEVAKNEEPYDVFICYKETDEHGKRTADSALAQDIYYQLKNEGFKVFFSRITLEDKLGTEYEPYIFAALNSSKVMLVIGTRADYFNAVWVKNEWERFLALMKKDKTKLIIPCYRDIDPYEIPDRLSMLQSQDMGKIGFMQDLIRGIKKIINPVKKSESVPVNMNVAGVNISAFLKRAFMCIEDSDYEKAAKLLEEVLNNDPENSHAYLGKVMLELDVKREEDIPEKGIDLSEISDFKRALEFADEEHKSVLEGYQEEALAIKLKREEEAAKKLKMEKERAARIAKRRVELQKEIGDLESQILGLNKPDFMVRFLKGISGKFGAFIIFASIMIWSGLILSSPTPEMYPLYGFLKNCGDDAVFVWIYINIITTAIIIVSLKIVLKKMSKKSEEIRQKIQDEIAAKKVSLNREFESL